MRISKVLLFVFLTFTISAAQSQEIVFRSNGKVNYPLTRGEEKMLDSIQHKTFLFFLNEHHPEIGNCKRPDNKLSRLQYSSNRFRDPVIRYRC